MKNVYKRHDVFRCSQEAHREFDGRVSVYHVLREKSCYPQGCLYFVWHCVRMEKGVPCIKGYSYVGRACRGCTYYDEEKVHLQPERMLEADAYERFLEELDDFETWLEENRYRRLNIQGRIKSIKPWFQQVLYHEERQIRLRGYILVFRTGFIGMTHFEDTFYVRVSESLMKHMNFVQKMKVEMTGELREDRGRIVIHRPKRVEIIKPGWGRPWTRDKALVAVRTATLLKQQHESCISCRWGALADVTDRREREERRYRNLYCLKGIAVPEGCYIHAVKGSGRKREGKVIPLTEDE
jgi:hypothetical protein